MQEVEVGAFWGGLAAVGAIPEVGQIAANMDELTPPIVNVALYAGNMAIDEGAEDIVEAIAIRGEGIR